MLNHTDYSEAGCQSRMIERQLVDVHRLKQEIYFLLNAALLAKDFGEPLNARENVWSASKPFSLSDQRMKQSWRRKHWDAALWADAL